MSPTSNGRNLDFFISYQERDKGFAQWIAWILSVENNYSIVLQDWHFAPGMNFIQEMDSALRRASNVICVFSENYFESTYATSELYAAIARFSGSPTGKVIPIKVDKSRTEGLVKPIIWIDICVGDEELAKERLLEGVARAIGASESGKPRQKPIFPLDPSISASKKPIFPNDDHADYSAHLKNLLDQEFHTVTRYLDYPKAESSTCRLLYGDGGKEIDVEISKHALYLQVQDLLDSIRIMISRGSSAPNLRQEVISRISTTRWMCLVVLVANEGRNCSSETCISDFIKGLTAPQGRLALDEIISKLARELIDTSSTQHTSTIVRNILSELGLAAKKLEIDIRDIVAEEQRSSRHASRPASNESSASLNSKARVRLFFHDEPACYRKILNALSGGRVNIVSSESKTLIPGQLASADLSVSYDPVMKIEDRLQAILDSPDTRKILFSFKVRR